jgi:hypothetical protein
MESGKAFRQIIILVKGRKIPEAKLESTSLAAGNNTSAKLFVVAKISQLALLP